jgi:hypothetical protein
MACDAVIAATLMPRAKAVAVSSFMDVVARNELQALIDADLMQRNWDQPSPEDQQELSGDASRRRS